MVHDLSKPSPPEGEEGKDPQEVVVRQSVDPKGGFCVEVQFIDRGNFVFAKMIPGGAAVGIGKAIAEIGAASAAGVAIAPREPAPAPRPVT